MNPKFLKTILTLTPVFCFATTAFAEEVAVPIAQNPDPRAAAKAALILRYDKNTNGKLDNDEIETIGRDRMLENDSNKDGRVDQVELQQPKAGTLKMPLMDALQRAVALEYALAAAKVQLEKERVEAAVKSAEGNEK